MTRVLADNFRAMPFPLKHVTIGGAVALLFGVAPLLMSSPIHVFGHDVLPVQWLRAGIGWIGIAVGGVLFAASILMLRRSRRARITCSVGWLGLAGMSPLAAWLLDLDIDRAMPSFVANLVLAVLIAAYLFASPAVGRYLAPMR